MAQTSPSTQPASAVLKVLANVPAGERISPLVTGKFCEHLGANIYNGMSAQIVRNPSFADFPFWTGGNGPDGRAAFYSDEAKIAEEIRRLARRLGVPEGDIDHLIEARADGMAFWWLRQGPRQAVRVSPDVGPRGGRAQRVEADSADQGIAQWLYLPLHRCREYEYQVMVRSPEAVELAISLAASGQKEPAAVAPLPGISRKWTMLRGKLRIAASAPADAMYRLALTAPRGGHFVVSHVMLTPADAINGADADVVKLLKESHLPLLRWPGGNFVSGYRWEDGVGPIEGRPTRPNWAWGGVEPNHFGTDEFVAFCRAVGCEPMICVNAADAGPDEAARWIEYCNGPATSPMGAKRAANGHPQPYNIRHWEVGNETWGRWQVNWTTPRGNADRYREFAAAMLKADPSIRLYACGAPVLWGADWNRALFAGAADMIRCTTDHPLIGGHVAASVDPMDIYRDFMAVPQILEGKWAELRKSMRDAGVAEPHLAITELQLFAHIQAVKEGDPAPRLTGANLVSPSTHAEAMYDTLLYHTAVRLAPFVEMVTHSATVNHGGGLRKEHERVYANPCHYAQSAFAAFAGATPVSIQLTSAAERPPVVLPDIKNAAAGASYTQVAALAAVASDGALLVSLVNRSAGAPVRLAIQVDGFRAAAQAEVWSLSAPTPWSGNTLAAPDAVRPATSTVTVVDGSLTLDLPPYAVARVRVPVAR